MTAEKLEEIKSESKSHSENLSEATSEALLKELCWSIYHDTKINTSNISLFSWGTINCYQELLNRINKRYGPEGEESDFLEYIKAYDNLRNLIDEQEKCSKVSTSPKKFRNEALRSMEGVLKVRTIIGDVWLP